MQQTQTPQKNKGLSLVVVIASALIVIGAVSFFVVRQGDDDESGGRRGSRDNGGAQTGGGGGGSSSVVETPITGTLSHPGLDRSLVGLSGCSVTQLGLVPLTDFGLTDYGDYQGFEPGLYPGGTNLRPSSLTEEGIALAGEIEPLDQNGNPSSSGKIVLLSMGLSNTNIEFDDFIEMVEDDPDVNPDVVVVNGAQGANPITDWGDNPRSGKDPWSGVLGRLSDAGVTVDQVQAVWMKHGFAQNPSFGAFPLHAETFQDELTNVIERAVDEYPNLKLIYLSSRTRAYTTEPGQSSPEPYAYELGFAVKWVVEDFIDGKIDAPWVAWGPYIWANGEDGDFHRADGFVWNCEDTRSVAESHTQRTNPADFMHPSAAFGGPKVGAELLSFFKTDETAAPWFLK